MKIIINYKDKDKLIRFKYRKELYKIINEYGYKYVSHFCIYIYFNKKKSSKHLAVMLGVTPQCVTKWMKKWSFKLRRTGGKAIIK